MLTIAISGAVVSYLLGLLEAYETGFRGAV
jgi:hypothetical protein